MAGAGWHWGSGGLDGIFNSGGDKMIGKIRPQIFLAILCATLFSVFACWVGYKMSSVEVLTLIVGSLMGFLAGVSLKVLENE